MFVKTGDKVKVIAGSEKGKEGTVLSVNVKKNRVVVKGVNMIKTVSYTHLTLPTICSV